MARDKRKGGHTTPTGTRPAHLRPVRDPADEGSPADDVIDEGGRELIDEGDPIAAETWASGLLGIFDAARLHARLESLESPPLEHFVLERCRQRRDRCGLVVAAALAAVLPPPEDREARAVVADLSRSVSGAPSWLPSVGRVAPTRAWRAADVFGDQESLIIAFSQEGESGEHALVVLIDHNLSGQAKDAFLAADVDDVVTEWKSHHDDHMQFDEVAANEALRRVRDAMATSDLWNGDTELRSQEFAQHRALIWARLRRAGLSDDPRVDAEAEAEVSEHERDALVEAFLASPEAEQVDVPGADLEILAGYLVRLRADYEGRPLRWSPNVVLEVLLDLAPRKLLLDADQAAALPAVTRAFVRFAGARAGLGERFVAETLATIDEVEPEFLDRIGDLGGHAGPAKTVLAALQARGVDLSDLDAINAAIEQDILPKQLALPAPKQRRRSTAAPVEVVASAQTALILARIDTLTAFYGEGRKLTQTGQPTLADARALVDLLGTADRFDETIGDKTFKTTSAAELPELGFTIRWAKTAGALRKEHGKLKATAAWRKLDAKPLERWLKAVDALSSLGPLAGYSDREEFLDELTGDILHLLRTGPQPFDAVLDWVCDRADVAYEWLSPYMQDPDNRRRSFGRDLDRLALILGWAGIAERIGAVTEADRYDSTRLRVVGGTLQLTPVGRWWLGAPIRERR